MISEHSFGIAQYFHHQMDSLCHGNGQKLAMMYCETGFDDITKQGAIVNFNLMRSSGQYVGFAEVRHNSSTNDKNDYRM